MEKISAGAQIETVHDQKKKKKRVIGMCPRVHTVRELTQNRKLTEVVKTPLMGTGRFFLSIFRKCFALTPGGREIRKSNSKECSDVDVEECGDL
jgi:hypothetical protein